MDHKLLEIHPKYFMGDEEVFDRAGRYRIYILMELLKKRKDERGY